MLTTVLGTQTSGGAAPSPANGGSPLGGASIMLGIAVGAALIVLFIAMLIVRRWALGRGSGERREDPRARVDPWFEAGRRMQMPDRKGPDADGGAA